MDVQKQKSAYLPPRPIVQHFINVYAKSNVHRIKCLTFYSISLSYAFFGDNELNMHSFLGQNVHSIPKMSTFDAVMNTIQHNKFCDFKIENFMELNRIREPKLHMDQHHYVITTISLPTHRIIIYLSFVITYHEQFDVYANERLTLHDSFPISMCR